LNSPSYFYQREIQPGELGSLERSDFEEQQENSGKQGEEEDGMLESDSPNDDGDTPSLTDAVAPLLQKPSGVCVWSERRP